MIILKFSGTTTVKGHMWRSRLHKGSVQGRYQHSPSGQHSKMVQSIVCTCVLTHMQQLKGPQYKCPASRPYA